MRKEDTMNKNDDYVMVGTTLYVPAIVKFCDLIVAEKAVTGNQLLKAERIICDKKTYLVTRDMKVGVTPKKNYLLSCNNHYRDYIRDDKGDEYLVETLPIIRWTVEELL